MSVTTLVVDFCGERQEPDPSQPWTFGRGGDLVVDDENPYLHRVVGLLRRDGQQWWLENAGSYIELVVVAASGSTTRLAPLPHAPPSMALVEPTYRVGFAAGATTYELDLLLPGRAPTAATPRDGPGDETVRPGQVTLTDDERALVLALARPRLLDPTAGPDKVPPNRAVAAALGWRITRFNRKLDYLCERLTKAGVKGLHGERGAGAGGRRWQLVQHVVSTGLVTRADLDEPGAAP